jgi:hypothetical protein
MGRLARRRLDGEHHDAFGALWHASGRVLSRSRPSTSSCIKLLAIGRRHINGDTGAPAPYSHTTPSRGKTAPTALLRSGMISSCGCKLRETRGENGRKNTKDYGPPLVCQNEGCRTPFLHRYGESVEQYQRRKFCSQACCNEDRRSVLRPRVCEGCGQEISLSGRTAV